LQSRISHFSRRKDADSARKQQQREKANQASKREIRQVQAFNFEPPRSNLCLSYLISCSFLALDSFYDCRVASVADTGSPMFL